MNTRLVRETSCVHGYFQDCTFKTDDGLDCPGGISREVEVDYEAAWTFLRRATWQIPRDIAVGSVDAALGGGV